LGASLKALVSHPGVPNITKPEQRLFTDLLVATEVHQSTKFYADIQGSQEVAIRLGVTPTQYSDLSLRRVLRLYNIEPEYKMNFIKRAWGDFLSTQEAFSSNALTRSLRADIEASKELLASPWPFAVLAKLKSYSTEHSQSPRAISSKPLIVIPGIEQMGAVLRWEDRNTVQHKY
jgi:hypothetical protein